MIRSKRGFILIIVIGLLGVMGMVALQLVQQSEVAGNVSRNSMNRLRSAILARSGIEMATVNAMQNLGTDVEVRLGAGTLRDGGDGFQVKAMPANAKINLNDGISAGQLELGASYVPNKLALLDPTALPPPQSPIYTGSYLMFQGGSDFLLDDGIFGDPAFPWDQSWMFKYIKVEDWSAQLVAENWGSGEWWVVDDISGFPYPNIDWTYHGYEIYENDPDGGGSADNDPSAMINLRVRRLLNAYGDVHRFLAQIGEPPAGYNTPFTYTAGDAEDYGALYEAGDGLGDAILPARTAAFRSIEDVKGHVDAWGATHLPASYVGSDGFFELCRDDFTVEAYEDTSFFRLTTEPSVYWNAVTASSTYAGHKMEIRRLDTEPLDLASYNWTRHPISPISINQASFHVKAALLFAPANVSFLCENAATEYFRSDKPANVVDDLNSQPQARNPIFGLGVGGAVFSEAELKENGVPTLDSKNRLMSLRDALVLARALEDEIYGTPPKTFEEFGKTLASHRQLSPLANEWVAAGPYSSDPISGGFFTADYLEKVLPHVLSLNRRTPGFLGAPAPLLSPYVATDARQFGATDVELRGVQRRVEDFVWRFHIPKISFFTLGAIEMESTGFLEDSPGRVRERTTITAAIAPFDARFFRTQADFESITDTTLTSSGILIGPERTELTVGTPVASVTEASPFIGFVGLKDVNEPVAAQCQIAMNFNKDSDPAAPVNHYGADESWGCREVDGTNPPMTAPENDPWLNQPGGFWVNQAPPQSPNTDPLLDSRMEQPDTQFFANSSSGSDLSPFGGAFFGAQNHGYKKGDPDFQDSLFWRLLDSFSQQQQPNTLFTYADPSGVLGRRGLIELWCRIPTTYSFAQNNGDEDSDNFLATVCTFNFWQHAPIVPDNTWYQSTTIGLYHRFNNDTGRHEFIARLEQGERRYVWPSVFNMPDVFRYHGSDQQQIPKWADDPSLNPQTDLLSLCPPWDTGYATWKSVHPRYLEKRIILKDVPENAAGSWHKFSMGWDIERDTAATGWGAGAWSGSPEQWYGNRFWLRMHDTSNVESHEAEFAYYNQNGTSVQRKTTAGGSAPASVTDNTFDTRPRDANFTFTLGEQQRRLISGPPNVNQNVISYYYPGWRFNSCIDNLRFSLGAIPAGKSGYDGAAYVASEPNRYKVDTEPEWVVRLPVPVGRRVIDIGSRIYNPQDSNVAAPNHPRVDVNLWRTTTGTPYTPSSTTNDVNDQVRNYFGIEMEADTVMKFIYKNESPGQTPLINDGTDNWSEIPWIKEVSVIYATNRTSYTRWKVD